MSPEGSTAIARAEAGLRRAPRTWLVTGVAGFIGSNLLQRLLELGQTVVGLDNFATGKRENLDEVLAACGDHAHRFRFIEGDIRDLQSCRDACAGADYVLHQAALGSVPRSIDDPLLVNAVNVVGGLNVLQAAREAGVRRLVFAASSAVYGDHPGLPKVEDAVGRPLSPYAVTKYVNELYAGVFQRVYGLETIGLRYFNVFGRRQDPDGAYAAVIPRWVGNLLAGRPCVINGDGETSRDFCFVDNVVQANLLAATAPSQTAGVVYNVAQAERTTLNQLFGLLRAELSAYRPDLAGARPEYAPFRVGDVRHSEADISRIREALGYRPTHRVSDGLRAATAWYAEHMAEAGVS
ncbi:MAG TPA: SDR family oxidoreductase [Longimicrobium sp.]|jgi:UDP-N-acetylglucosamine 4-epimerase|uniref:SDR family oxidoreductase n=1 Tax=Longimicrobium sp. TaxID=2029185 RepID=UPI002ED79C90